MPEIVERPLLWPNQCAECGSIGPGLIDTGVELNGAFPADPNQPMTGTGYGRLYHCKTCVRSWAKLYGFSPGKKLDELQNASEALEQRDKNISNLTKQNEQLMQAVVDRDRKLNQQQIVIDKLEEENETRKHQAGILKANAEALVS